MNTPSHGSKVARKDIPAVFQWKIQDIYATQEEWEKACTALKELIAELETCKGSLKDAGILLQALQLRDRMSQEIDKIYAYARLQQDADNGDVNAQALSGKAEGILAAFYNAVSFIDSEVTSLPKEQLEQLKNDPTTHCFPTTVFTWKTWNECENTYCPVSRKQSWHKVSWPPEPAPLPSGHWYLPTWSSLSSKTATATMRL